MPGTGWKPWHWLEPGLVLLASIVMRVAWLTPLIHLMLNNALVTPQGTRYPAWLVLVLLLASWALRRSLRTHPWGRGVGGAAGFVAVWAALAYLSRVEAGSFITWVGTVLVVLTDFREGLPAALLVVGITAAVWRSGLVMSLGYHGDFWRGFLRGIIVLGLLLLLSGRPVWWTADFNPWVCIISFLVSGLFGLALLSRGEALTLADALERPVARLSRYWVAAVGSVVLVILLAGWALGQVLTPDALAQAWRMLSPVARLLGRGLMYVLMAIAYVVIWVLEPLMRLVRAGMTEGATDLLGMQPSLREQFGDSEIVPRELTPALQTALRFAFLLAICGGIALALVMARLGWRSSHKGSVSEKREYIWSRKLLGGQLRGLLRRTPKARAGPPFLELPDMRDPRQAIRRLYQRLLVVASTSGHPRPPGLTPSAYQGVLESLVPSEKHALRALTSAYLLARYAPQVPTVEQAGEARRALAQIEAALGSEVPESGHVRG